ncbi:MAG: hypothetical protein HRT38_03505 [Alteromonadaceae bacterium]|nr:hypothetical protein [Alteromonadaceae bacterium]
MTQASFWQDQQQTACYAELCNALYERELRLLVNADISSVQTIQSRLKGLPYYINRTAHSMTEAESPLVLDVQNASWSVKQENKMPLNGQEAESVCSWYSAIKLSLGLVVPVSLENYIILDCIDRIDHDNQRFRTNVSGWFYLNEQSVQRKINEHKNTNGQKRSNAKLLKPNKRVMSAACAGHHWQKSGKISPVIPGLRELLLSCSINWRNFKRPLAVTVN